MTTWIVPCNSKFFDIQSHLNDCDEIVWQTSSDMKPNDQVYVYVCGHAETGEIKYKGWIKEIHLSDTYVNQNSYCIRPTKQRKDYVLIKIEKSFSDGMFPLKELRSHGLNQFQKQSKASADLIEYLKNSYRG